MVEAVAEIVVDEIPGAAVGRFQPQRTPIPADGRLVVVYLLHDAAEGQVTEGLLFRIDGSGDQFLHVTKTHRMPTGAAIHLDHRPERLLGVGLRIVQFSEGDFLPLSAGDPSRSLRDRRVFE